MPTDKYEIEMRLPPGETCASCAFFRRCQGFIGVKGHETSCDWHPSRFVPGRREEASSN
ncbi:MAG TPA: hypothetical protein VHY20_11350 [Pirellulales bacterium]|jgi:hypothetical protein|nr:hypothetical protein [Pirellulales bacterium]